MLETEIDFEKVCGRFSQVHWHDSKLLNIHLLKDPEKRAYSLRLDINLIINFSGGKVERRKKTTIFKECRIVQTNLDLLGVLMCGGAVASGSCYKDATQLERNKRNQATDFDLPQDNNPLEKCVGFHIEMIHPGGDIVIFARDFDIIDEVYDLG